MDSPHDPHDVVPPDFCENWGRETIPEALAAAEAAQSTTDESERLSCPWCGSLQVDDKRDYTNHNPTQQKDPDYRCGKSSCWRWFNEPADENTILATADRAEPFDWLRPTELADADERTNLSERYEGGPDDRPAKCRRNREPA